MAKAVIIGAGLMGSAMAWPLSDNGHEVSLVGTHLDDGIIRDCLERGIHPRLNRHLPSGVSPVYFNDIDTVIGNADIIVSGVSSPGVEWISQVLSSRVKRNQQILSITKGLQVDDKGRLCFFPDIIVRGLPGKMRDEIYPVAVGGPCIAGELAARRPTCVMFGSRNRESAEKCISFLKSPYYFLSPTDDLESLEIGVALKNAFTVAVGIAYGMHKEDEAKASMHNTAAALFAQSCCEIGQILSLAGANPGMAATLPGAGDLYVTSAGGRTITLGRLLGEGKTYKEAELLLQGVTLESVQIIRAMSKAIAIWDSEGKTRPGSFPLLRMLIAIVVDGKGLEIPFGSFFNNQ